MLTENTRSLISLLDDDDPDAAATVMAEILRRPDLDEILSEAQESEVPLIRRRVHQLQMVHQSRKIRCELSHYIESEKPDLLQGLMGLHFQWFDNDERDIGHDEIARVFQNAGTFAIHTDDGFCDFFRSLNYQVTSDTCLLSSDYCLGEFLDTHRGSALLITAFAACVAERYGIPYRIVAVRQTFGLLTRNNTVILPENNFEQVPMGAFESIKILKNKHVLKFAAAQLFSAAVAQNNFRYAGSLGLFLANMEGLPDYNHLPLPYGKTASHCKFSNPKNHTPPPTKDAP